MDMASSDLRRDENASNSVITTWKISYEQIREKNRSAADLQGIPESVLPKDNKGRMLLSCAAWEGRKVAVEQLLARNDVEADSKDDNPSARRPIAWSRSETTLRGIGCYEVPGTFNGVPVDALPDWGSPVDAVSEDFARQHGLKIKAAHLQLIPLLGGHIAESVGRIVGHFEFRGEGQVHCREFHVLRKSVYDLVLGRKFLNQTKTLTEFCHRIVKRVRPCVQKGSRLFLLDESPKDRLRCEVNGAQASAIPDTGSELMLVSGNFTRRNNLKVYRGREYRRPVELINGSPIYTDGMVLNAELQFDAPLTSSRELDYDQYVDFTAGLSSLNSHGTGATEKATFICDLHVIEDLPCDIILSNDFIFENRVFSRFKSLFYSEPANTSPGGDMILDDGLLFIRLKRSRFSWLRQLRRPPQGGPNIFSLQGGASWEECWKIEEERRNQTHLRIASLVEPHKSAEQKNENQKQAEWDRNNPRPPPPPITCSTSSNPSLTRTQVPRVPSPVVLHSTEGSARSINSLSPECPDGFLQPRLPGNV